MQLADLLARLDTNKPKPVPVDVPGVGQLFVLPPTVGDMDEVREPIEGETKKRGIARGLARSLCDAEGVRYGEVPELIEALSKQSWKALEKLTAAANQSVTGEAGNV